jgi:FkbM family methyltransferase
VNDISLVELSEDFQCYAPTDPDGHFLELRFVFAEIFGGHTYTQEIARLPEDAVVLDIGANVGMFSLCVKAAKPGATVLAFEPMPPTLDALHKNIELHELSGITVYPVALGTEEDSCVEFTFYPQAPANSTRYPEQKLLLLPIMDESITVPVDVTTAAAILASRPELERIDLVKIDVEGAELEVLNGLSASDWDLVRAFVIEVNDIDGRLDAVCTLLTEHGYAVTAGHAPLIPEDQEMYLVHATRN